MAYEFTKLTEVEALTEVPENASVFAEVDGEIKRVPGAGLGGESGIKTAIIKSSDYDNTVAGVSAAAGDPVVITYSCINMTFEEAYETMSNGEPLACLLMFVEGGATNLYGFTMFAGTMLGTPCIGFGFEIISTSYSQYLYWTPDGISTTAPSEGE